MARFQYNKFLEHSGKPKKPPLLSKRMEDNRISFRIDEEEQINDPLWQYGDGDYGTAGFKMTSGRFTEGTRIAATWSDKQFTSWVESFHLKPLREEFVFSVDDSTIEVDFDLDLVLPTWVIIYYYDDYSWSFPEFDSNTPVDETPDGTDVVNQIPEGADVPLLAITLSPRATRHNTPEVPLVFTVSMLNFDGAAEPVDYDMLVPLRVMSSGAAGTDYELSGIIPSSAFGDGPASRFDVGAFALIPRGETSVDVTVTPLNPANQDTVDITLEVMPLFAFTKNFNPIDNPDIGSPEGTNPLDVNTVPDVEALQTGYLTPSLLTANYTFEPAGEGNGGDNLNLENRVPESDECRGTSQSAPYVPDKGFYLGTLKTQVIASGDIEAYPSTTATLSLVPQDPDATQYWDLGDPVNLQVSTVDGVKTITVNVTAGAVNNDQGIVHEGSIPIVTSDPFKPTNINIVPSTWGKEGEEIPGTQQPGMPGYRPSPTGSNPTTLGTTPGAPSKYSFNSPPLWDYQVSFPPNAPPGAFIKPSVGVDAIKSNPYTPAVIQFPSASDVNVPAQVWTDNNPNPLDVNPLACLNYQLQIFLELYSTYPNEDPEDTTVRIPEGHEDPLQIIIRIVLLGDVREDYSSEEMPLAVSLAGTATPDTDYTILGEGQTPISGTEVLADYQFSENVLGVYVPAGVLNAQLKEVTIQVPVAILLDEEEEGDETIEVTPLFPEQPEEGSTPLILWESYETTIAIILGQLADILYNFKVLQDGGKLEGFGQDLTIELPDIIIVDIPTVVVGGGATYTFPQDSELFVCYAYLLLSDAPLGSSITANVYNISLPGSPTILDSILTVPAGQTRSNPVTLDRTIFNQGDILQVAILSVGSEFPGAGMQLFLGRKYGEGEKIDWERVGLTNTGNGYISLFYKLNEEERRDYFFTSEAQTLAFTILQSDPLPYYLGYGTLLQKWNNLAPISGELDGIDYTRYKYPYNQAENFVPFAIAFNRRNVAWFMTRTLIELPSDPIFNKQHDLYPHGNTPTFQHYYDGYFRDYILPVTTNDKVFSEDGDTDSFFVAGTYTTNRGTTTFSHASTTTLNTKTPFYWEAAAPSTGDWTQTLTSEATKNENFTWQTTTKLRFGNQERSYAVTTTESTTASKTHNSTTNVYFGIGYDPTPDVSFASKEGGSVDTNEEEILTSSILESGVITVYGNTTLTHSKSVSRIASITFVANYSTEVEGMYVQSDGGEDYIQTFDSDVTEYTRVERNEESTAYSIPEIYQVGKDCALCALSVGSYNIINEFKYTKENFYPRDLTTLPEEVVASPTFDESYWNWAIFAISENGYIEPPVSFRNHGKTAGLTTTTTWGDQEVNCMYLVVCVKENQYYKPSHSDCFHAYYWDDYDDMPSSISTGYLYINAGILSGRLWELAYITQETVERLNDFGGGVRYSPNISPDFKKIISMGAGTYTVQSTTNLGVPQLTNRAITFLYYEATEDTYYSYKGVINATIQDYPGTYVDTFIPAKEVVDSIITLELSTRQKEFFAFGYYGANIIVSDDDWGSIIDFNPRSDANLYTVTDDNGNETVELAISEQKPSNNNFGGAVLLEGQNVSVRGNNYGADQQSNNSEPELSSPTQSVWYKWVAPSSTPVTIHTLGSPVAADYQVDTVIAVYTGSSLDSLSLVASNNDASVELPPNGDYLSAVVINPVEGTTYYIQVDGWSDTQWSFVLSITTEGLNVPTPIQEETRRADIYRFDTQTLKWKRMPNAVSAISPLTGASDFISYHATPQTEPLTGVFICPEE